MAYVSNLLHCVWATKNRIIYFNDQNTQDIIGHILTNAQDQGIWMDQMNAYQNYLHCLISLNPDQCLSTVIKQVKGESSYWINRNIKMDQKFRWGVEYYASSVSIKMLPVVRKYIQNQEVHHQKRLGPRKKRTTRLS